MDDWIVLEWSESQKQFHNASFQETAKAGTKAFLERKNRDWMVVGFFKTADEALTASAMPCAKRGMVWNGREWMYEDMDGERN